MAASKQEPEKVEEALTESQGRVHPRDYKIFWGKDDKGAAKPAFCYERRCQELKEEVDKMEKNLAMGYISAERKMAYEQRLRQRKERLDSIMANTERAKKIVEKDKDWWAKRRDELAKDISDSMPSRKDVQKRRVNPHRIAKMEKGGLGQKKLEYVVISRLLGEESNTSFLQRD